MRKIQSTNPFTGELKQTFDFISNEELSAKIQRASQGYELHRSRSYEDRAAMLIKLGKVIERRFQ